jgi:hypothetical protein
VAGARRARYTPAREEFTDMVAITRRTRVLEGVEPGEADFAALIEAGVPTILRGYAAGWPLVAAGRGGPEAAAAYLKRFDAGRTVTGYTGAPEISGRFHYNEQLTGMNFAAERVRLGEYLDRILARREDPRAPAFYVGSTDVDTFLPGLRDENDLSAGVPLFDRYPPLMSIWIGNRTVAAAHWDQSNNIACCLVGRRRFTLFPPEQVANLYPGPLEPTPAGQVVTMVDLRAPDLDRYPRYAEAAAAGEVAELAPGDVLVYPALWWHQVEALDGFNAMINYWWNAAPDFADTPMTTLLHGLLSLRSRPAGERRAWRAMFEHYLFDESDAAAAHLPEPARGPLGVLDPAGARRLRAQVINRLNR